MTHERVQKFLDWARERGYKPVARLNGAVNTLDPYYLIYSPVLKRSLTLSRRGLLYPGNMWDDLDFFREWEGGENWVNWNGKLAILTYRGKKMGVGHIFPPKIKTKRIYGEFRLVRV